MDENYVLSYDMGTQSVRAIIFDKNGNIVNSVQRVYEQPYFSVKDGYAEQHGDFYWEELCIATKELKKKSKSAWHKLKAISITTCRDVVTCLDKNNSPLRPFILYCDQRRVTHLNENINPLLIETLKLVGMWDLVSTQYSASFCNWIKKYEPYIWSQTDKFVPLSTYIHFKMLGELCDSVASQVGHIPFDYKKKDWKSKYDLTSFIFEAKIDKMNNKLYKPCEIMGYVSKKVSEETGLPENLAVVASGADKACETLAVGCQGKDVAAISLGTSASIEITTDKYIEPMPFLPAYPSIHIDKFNPEVLVFRGFWMVSWFKNNFAKEEIKEAEKKGCMVEDILDEKMMDIPVGCGGLVLQPYWSPCLQAPKGKGLLIGFSDYHTKYHIYRAIIEGIGFELYNALLKMEKRSGYRIRKIRLSGGGSKSEKVCQLMADLFGKTIQKVQTSETSALGAAMASFTGVGEFRNLDEAVGSMSKVTKEYYPNAYNHFRYNEIYKRVYRRLYPTNKKTYRNITLLRNN